MTSPKISGTTSAAMLMSIGFSVLVPTGGARRRQGDWRQAYAQQVMGAAGAERARAAALGRRARSLGPRDGRLSPANAVLAADAFFARAVSPSAVEAYLKCPFAFYLRHILGIDVPDEPDELLEIEPIELGNLAHRILEDAYSQSGGARDAVLGALERAAADGFARAERDGVTGFPLAWQVLRGQLLDDLRHTVATDPSWHDGVLPADFERRFGYDDDWPVVEVPVGGRIVRFHGRIDRVDRSDDGRVRLVDYKSGKGTTEQRHVDKGLDVALPVYVLALVRRAELAGERPREVTALYRMVRRTGGFATVTLDVGPDGGLDAVRGQLGATLAVAVHGIEDGLYVRMPDYRGCDYCDAKGRCLADRYAYAVKKHDPALAPILGYQDGVVAPATAS